VTASAAPNGSGQESECAQPDHHPPPEPHPTGLLLHDRSIVSPETGVRHADTLRVSPGRLIDQMKHHPKDRDVLAAAMHRFGDRN
jgi:hypothetical protein